MGRRIDAKVVRAVQPFVLTAEEDHSKAREADSNRSEAEDEDGRADKEPAERLAGRQ